MSFDKKVHNAAYHAAYYASHKKEFAVKGRAYYASQWNSPFLFYHIK